MINWRNMKSSVFKFSLRQMIFKKHACIYSQPSFGRRIEFPFMWILYACNTNSNFYQLIIVTNLEKSQWLYIMDLQAVLAWLASLRLHMSILAQNLEAFFVPQFCQSCPLYFSYPFLAYTKNPPNFIEWLALTVLQSKSDDEDLLFFWL